jgi:hypothetical protein
MAACQDGRLPGHSRRPAKKKTRPGVNDLTVEQTRHLLAQPDRSTRRGRRDATLLATLYDTAARFRPLGYQALHRMSGTGDKRRRCSVSCIGVPGRSVTRRASCRAVFVKPPQLTSSPP